MLSLNTVNEIKIFFFFEMNEWIMYFYIKCKLHPKEYFFFKKYDTSYNSIIKYIQVFYVIIFWLWLSISKTANFKLNNISLENVKSIQYLGFEIAYNGNIKAMMNDRILFFWLFL